MVANFMVVATCTMEDVVWLIKDGCCLSLEEGSGIGLGGNYGQFYFN